MIIRLNNFSFFGKLFLGVALCLFGGMLYFACDTQRFLSGSVETMGSIADYVEKEEASSDGRDVKNYYPVIRYYDNRGNQYSFTSDTVMNYEVWVFIKAKESGFKNPVYEVPGIKVRYPADNPSAARAARSFFDLWGSSIAYAFLAVVFFLLGSVLLWLDKRS